MVIVLDDVNDDDDSSGNMLVILLIVMFWFHLPEVSAEYPSNNLKLIGDAFATADICV